MYGKPLPADKGKQVVTFSHAFGSPEYETFTLETTSREMAEAWAKTYIKPWQRLEIHTHNGENEGR